MVIESLPPDKAKSILSPFSTNPKRALAFLASAKIDLVNGRSCEFVSNDGKRFKGKSNAYITQFSLPKGQFYCYLKCKRAA